MNKKERFIAQYKDSHQITEDSWKIVNPTLQVSLNTTIEDIYEWFKKQNNNNKARMEISIIQTESLSEGQ